MDEHTTKEDRLGGGPMVDTAPGSRWSGIHALRIIRCLLLVNTLVNMGQQRMSQPIPR
jgi:hypothetical protein